MEQIYDDENSTGEDRFLGNQVVSSTHSGRRQRTVASLRKVGTRDGTEAKEDTTRHFGAGTTSTD